MGSPGAGPEQARGPGSPVSAFTRLAEKAGIEVGVRYDCGLTRLAEGRLRADEAAALGGAGLPRGFRPGLQTEAMT